MQVHIGQQKTSGVLPMKYWLGLLPLFFVSAAQASPSQLPNGEQCFQTANGPVSSGSLQMYFPNTTTTKPTFQDMAGTVQNTAPIQLDANGCAIMWGTGVFRQQLWSGPVVNGFPTGDLIFDLPTQDISSQFNLTWGGLATGTVNSIQLLLGNWNPVSGFNIQFLPIGNNTGPVTISPNTGVTPITVVKDTISGPIGLSGSELGPNNVANVVYDATAAVFHLQNPLTSATAGGGVPIGAEISCAGFAAPTGFLFESGQQVSRTTFATLLGLLTQAQNGTLNGTTLVTGLGTTEQYATGMPVEGANIPGSTTIANVNSATSITLSQAATGSGVTSLTFFAYGNGDGSTTFNLPDRRGRYLVGRDNMNNSVAGVLTSTYTTNTPDALGQILSSPATVGGGGIQIGQANLPAQALNVTIPSNQGAHSHSTTLGGGSAVGTTAGSTNLTPGGGFTYNGPVGNATLSVTVNAATLPALAGSTSLMGSSVAISPIGPSATSNFCMRVQ